MTGPLKAGMVGLDTSHCRAFLEVFNDASNPYHIPGITINGVYRGGSELFAFSRERIGEFAGEIEQRFHVPTYENIAELAQEVDVLFLTSVDGRQHLEQFEQMAVGKPVYIDKPFATSTVDAAAIFGRAAATSTPVMSCSSLRFAEGIPQLAQLRDETLACEAYGPAPILPDYPGYFWYGIHSAEMLFLMMGSGCRSVRTLATEQMDILQGVWADGRSGAVLGMRIEGYEFGCLAHTRHGARLSVAQSTPPYHASLAKAIAEFFQSGESPVSAKETFEIIAFLEAADQSRNEGSSAIPLVAAPDWL